MLRIEYEESECVGVSLSVPEIYCSDDLTGVMLTSPSNSLAKDGGGRYCPIPRASHDTPRPVAERNGSHLRSRSTIVFDLVYFHFASVQLFFILLNTSLVCDSCPRIYSLGHVSLCPGRKEEIPPLCTGTPDKFMLSLLFTSCLFFYSLLLQYLSYSLLTSNLIALTSLPVCPRAHQAPPSPNPSRPRCTARPSHRARRSHRSFNWEGSIRTLL